MRAPACRRPFLYFGIAGKYGNLSRMLRVLLICTTLVVPRITAADDGEIDEVLVTATRRSASAEDISAALTLVDADRARQQKLITDALADNVGVYLQQTTPGQGAAIIRGLKGSSILHLVDGMRLNNAIFRSAPTQYFSLVPIAAVERVEVVRGTPTSLYGNDAVGGVVQLVSRVPSFESSEMRVRGEAYAYFDTADLGKSARATVDIGNKELATSLSAEYLETGDRKTGSGDRIGPSGYDSKAARLVIAGTPDDRRSWLFDVHYLEQPETPRVDELVPGFGETEPSSSEFFFAPNRRTFVHGEYELADGPAGMDWDVDVSWQRIDDDRRSIDFGSTDQRREANRSDLYGLTLNGSRTTDAGSWVVGAEYYYDEVSSSRFEVDLSSGAEQQQPSRFPDGSRVRQVALYGNVQRFLADRHNVAAGIRVSNDDVSLAATAASNAADIDSTDVSGDIGYVFEVNNEWQLVANVGLGFRAPNVFDLGTLGNRPGNRFNIPNTSLESERVTQIDAGIRHRSARVKLDVMLYALQYDDRITSVGTGETTPEGRDIVQAVNAAESSIRGVEAGVAFELSDDIDLRGVLNYTWGEQEVTGGDDEPADRIPPLSGSVTATYDAGGDYRLQGWLRFADEQDRLSVRDVRDSRIDPDGTDGWVVLGARLDWQPGETWLLSVGVDNLFDEHYRVHGSGLDAPGRNLSFSVRRYW